ncbi:DNA replication and repair protein RecO [Cohaesibacter sp. ES.047]|uniref:DNA repair protein RecO n=1 Tax=Cohaesibacter sp. ES.047 TaxID=1798205 RepID=UPI000BB78C56|nr:DNA repair protein RecO [Cohaesibacter sp. ES.047]SNY93070.1 DNA replication and repair protein RecO [Cohaesibacter sp. ES.047]
MEWTDDAIILGTKRHGETSVLLEVMTRSHGRHMGLVRGGRSKRLQPVLQPGNGLRVTWRARLENHIGQFTAELDTSRAAALMAKPLGTYGMQFLAELTRLLPERDPHPYLFNALSVIVDELKEGDIAGELLVRYELALLTELGFGLSLDRCAATGQTGDLIYVSPKSGRAVSAEAGRPYQDRMLPLPAFLKGQALGNRLTFAELSDGFRLSAYFLDKHLYQPNGATSPSIRASFIDAIRRDLDLSE